jgi:hypothetical protein
MAVSSIGASFSFVPTDRITRSAPADAPATPSGQSPDPSAQTPETFSPIWTGQKANEISDATRKIMLGAQESTSTSDVPARKAVHAYSAM